MQIRRQLRPIGLTVALALAAGAPRAAAWGPVGHVIVAEIALYSLTPRARAAVDDILGDSELGDYDVASWSDSIRGNKAYDRLYPDNGRWHYVDFDTRERYDNNFKLELPGDGHDIVTQILRWRDELKRGKLKGERRLDALRFLVHFTADVHQPLHCAFRYGDLGGNMLPVRSFQGRHYSFGPAAPLDHAPNLHAAWDDYLVHELVANRRAKTVAAALHRAITPAESARWTQGDVLRWATDSYWIARKQAYRMTNGDHVPFKWTGPGMELTRANYIDSHLPVVAQQLQKAGLRLAHLLNTAFDPRYVSPNSAAAGP